MGLAVTVALLQVGNKRGTVENKLHSKDILLAAYEHGSYFTPAFTL